MLAKMRLLLYVHICPQIHKTALLVDIKTFSDMSKSASIFHLAQQTEESYKVDQTDCKDPWSTMNATLPPAGNPTINRDIYIKYFNARMLETAVYYP